MSLLVVNDKILLITGVYILNSKQIYPNKSDDTKVWTLFREQFQLTSGVLKDT